MLIHDILPGHVSTAGGSAAAVAAAAAATNASRRNNRSLGLISGTSPANYSSLITGRHSSKFDASTDSHHHPPPPPSASQDVFYYGGMTSGALDSLVSRTRSSTHRKGKQKSYIFLCLSHPRRLYS